MVMIQQLRDRTHMIYNKQKMASIKGNKTSTVSNLITQDPSLALEDIRCHDNARLFHKQCKECDPHANDKPGITLTTGKSHGASHTSHETQKLKTSGSNIQENRGVKTD